MTSKTTKILLNLLFGLMGCVGLYALLKSYGLAKIATDISELGWGFGLIALSYLPMFVFGAAAWWVLTDFGFRRHRPWHDIWNYMAINLVANSWNNIAPFVKALGEPLRAVLVAREIPMKRAVRSVMMFNLAQALGTISSFSLGAMVAPLIYPLRGRALQFSLGVAALALLLNLLIAFFLFRPAKRGRRKKNAKSRQALYWLRWAGHQIRKYARHKPGRLAAGAGLTIVARFSEGVMFYAIFAVMGHPLSILDSVMLSIGRGVADHLFFFVPYQVGTREASMVFVLSQLLQKPGENAVSAMLIFRLGELTWISFGFVLWLLYRRPRGEVGAMEKMEAELQSISIGK
jgi:Lysylphosphatidylglycerol synthase TM region